MPQKALGPIVGLLWAGTCFVVQVSGISGAEIGQGIQFSPWMRCGSRPSIVRFSPFSHTVQLCDARYFVKLIGCL
uniref:Secreted protein n=1 Tax=Anguilla anguilla TaxID=7936 RepID=A0A0E9Q6V5_ANGAN